MSEQKIPITLKGAKGQVNVNALLDSGASLSIINESIARKGVDFI